MKKILIFIVFVFSVFCIFAENTKQWFYNTSGMRVYLKETPTLVCIQNADEKGATNYQFIKKVKDLSSKENAIYPAYLDAENHIVGVDNSIIIKTKSMDDVDAFFRLTNTKGYTCENLFGNVFLLKFNKEQDVDIFLISQKLYEKKLVDFAEPNFIKEVKFDDISPMQWGMHNVGQSNGVVGVDVNAIQAWTITQGVSEVKVAVIDCGVQLDHPDLVGNLEMGYDATNSGGDGSPLSTTDYHGTFCSGIIVAKDNNFGISGIAPNCKVVPISFTPMSSAYFSETAILRAFHYADSIGADVISCSWSANLSDIVEEKMREIAETGRNGLGTMIICSSGNNWDDEIYNAPARYNFTTCVGSVNRRGERYATSNYGNKLDVVAPGVNIYSTTINSTYDTRTGTSYAAPMVAGVVALMISKCPYLTREQIRETLYSTCKKLDLYSYSYSTTHSFLLWNNETGYGLVNAYNALLRLTPEITGPDVVIGNSGIFELSNYPRGASVRWMEVESSIHHTENGGRKVIVSNVGMQRNTTVYTTISAVVTYPNGISETISKEVCYLYSGLQADNNNLHGNFYGTTGECWLDPTPIGASDFVWTISIPWIAESRDEYCFFESKTGDSYDGFANVSVSYKDASGQTSVIEKVFLLGENSNEYMIFPNPATESIQISKKENRGIYDRQLSKSISVLMILNDRGEQVLRRGYNESENTPISVDVSMLRTGNYYVKIFDGKKWIQKNLIIKK